MQIESIIHYTTIAIVLFICMFIYFKIANKYNITIAPNQRSSHDYVTLRGGGIIFWIAGMIFGLMHLPTYLHFLIGFTLICGISFWDDIKPLSYRIRITVHFIVIGLLLYNLNFVEILPWWLLILTVIFLVGLVNIYNFMDGINGITGLYSLAILISFQYVNQKMVFFVDVDFINYAIIACLVFLFFNYKTKAKCFAGDIGSVGLSFWIIYLMLQLIISTNSMIWILFLALYGVDSICTILHRIYLRQNIFEAHRLHFYQILSNECGISHLIVSAVYAIVQLIICFIVIHVFKNGEDGLSIYLYTLLPLVIIYISKFRLMKDSSLGKSKIQ